MEAGNKVDILRKDIRPLEHRQYPVRGTVTHVDGLYIYVRPSWCSWEIELYSWEVKLVKNGEYDGTV